MLSDYLSGSAHSVFSGAVTIKFYILCEEGERSSLEDTCSRLIDELACHPSPRPPMLCNGVEEIKNLQVLMNSLLRVISYPCHFSVEYVHSLRSFPSF